ncbi:Mitotic checkpoint protein BUB3.1, partial [Ananas comosus]
MEYSSASAQLITGSWTRRSSAGIKRCEWTGSNLIGTYPQPERVYSLSLVGHCLVVATAGRHVNVYDLRNMSRPEQKRESSLKYQTRCVRCYPDGTGFALSSVEGRVAMEFFDLSEAAQAKRCYSLSTLIYEVTSRFVFKCHRIFDGQYDTVYPVNTIAFHPIYGTFATGGCDGYVNVWDGNNKKRLYQYARYPSSIAALSFSRDGRLLAVASSYTFEDGNKPHEPDAIFVRNVGEVEVTPKPNIQFLYMKRGRTCDEASAAVKMAPAVRLFVSTGRDSIMARYHPTSPLRLAVAAAVVEEEAIDDDDDDDDDDGVEE